ncbi:UV-damage repair protein uvrX [Halothermothrix orenii]|uniref:DNA-directed DNA polymerase n=1 Tax=Halothermothrix orenii (strain H 168 / OCM 544 / DSM 9562) TaxID=373903 RepID=B8CXQ6_HALOH|nr:UV-damage repair protein uvrX [Halothermothrix orenii]ACL70075.1 DNA-directed DNA polymerase [Halothermothrix orenii H 168]
MEIDYSQLPRNSIMCIDMKSFYASIEAVARGLDPLKTCLAVVGDKQRSGSVVLAATPALKEKYNIRTGNRLYEIPDSSEIKIVEARMGLYLDKSIETTCLFNRFVPLRDIHVYSIDEAWLKLDGTERLFGDKWEVASKIKELLLKEMGLHCSIGLGPNMFLAKVAMDIEGKRKGIAEWTYEDVPEKLWPVKLEKCWGVGVRLARQFNRIGVRTVGDLAHLPLSYLENKYGIMGSQLYYHAWGVDLSKLEGHYYNQPKNVGKGVTLLRDYSNPREIKTVIMELCEEVARRARKENLAGKTIALTVGFSKDEVEKGFHVQRTIKYHTNLTMDIYQVCLDLFNENYSGQVVRKLAVSLGNFIPDSSMQLSLFEDKLKKINLARTMDRIRDKYGYTAILRARSLTRGAISFRQQKLIGGHKAR